jgi:site-specific DNA recombinase
MGCVQACLAENAVERATGIRVKNPSLLAGLLFDAEGQHMTPTHAIKNGRCYRYYVSRRLITDVRADVAAGLRIPAAEIEQIVVNRIRRLLSEPASLFEVFTAAQAGERQLQQAVIARADEYASGWARMSPLRQRVILLALVRRIDMGPDQVIIHIRSPQLVAFLEDRLTAENRDLADNEPTLPLSQPVQLRRAGKEVRMVIEHTDPFAPPLKPDATLIKAIVKAHRFNDGLLRSGASKFADLAKSEKLHRSYYSQILRLAYLAPDITTAILEGRQPLGLTATMLIEHPALPLSWQAQRAALGFA